MKEILFLIIFILLCVNIVEKFSPPNCYSYAVNKDYEIQPGELSNLEEDIDVFDCHSLVPKILQDFKGQIRIAHNNECSVGEMKIALFIDEDKEDGDYHFYREDKPYSWSHKRGYTQVSNVDADKKPIIDPRFANNDYGDYNYNKFCSFFCFTPKK